MVQEGWPTAGATIYVWQASVRCLESVFIVVYLAGICQASARCLIRDFFHFHEAAVGVILLMLTVFIDGTHLSQNGTVKCLPVYVSAGNIDSSVCR